MSAANAMPPAENAGLIVLVCGGRDYLYRRRVCAALDALHARSPVSVLVQGGAPGADSLARWWALHAGVCCITVQADWATHGPAAGPIRNQRMLDECRPALVVAFPGGRGTADMVRRARAAGVPVQEVKP